MAKAKFRVVDGKVSLPREEGKEIEYARKGEVVELDEEFVAKFVNKFVRVEDPPVVDAGSKAVAAVKAAVANVSKEAAAKLTKPVPDQKALDGALKALPVQIKQGKQKDPEYVVNAMRAHFGELFTDDTEEKVRGMFPATAPS